MISIKIAKCSSVYNYFDYEVLVDGKNLRAKRHVNIKDDIYVGDNLEIKYIGSELFIMSILPRKNIISRNKYNKIHVLASNVEHIFILTNPNRDFNIARLERYYIIAKESNANVYFVLSKSDLGDVNKYKEELKSRFNEKIFTVSVKDEDYSPEKLFDFWKKNETAIFLGSSGVGKSSLINYFLDHDYIKTNSVREKDKRGRHTTTRRNLYNLDNGRFIIDTPGLRSVGIDSQSLMINEIFEEIKELEKHCFFSDCSHSHEKDCAVKKAVKSGIITEDELIRYKKLKSEEKKYLNKEKKNKKYNRAKDRDNL